MKALDIIEKGRKISLAKKGKPVPKLLGNTNGFTKGQEPWNKGLKGLHLSPATEFSKGQIPINKGKTITEEHRQRLRISKLGKPAFWNGGSSYEPYGRQWSKALKTRIKQRDNHTCQECGVPEPECIHALHQHHINYDKQDCSESNLISLCSSCHSKTKFNREYWQKHFEEKIAKIYELGRMDAKI